MARRKASRNVVMLTIGTGIGGAILEDGTLAARQGTAGQLGHTLIDPHGRDCVCGKRGCVETVSSGTALGRHIAEAGLPAGTTAAELLARRDDGDAVADAGSQCLGRTAACRDRQPCDDASIPTLFVLGGGLGDAALQGAGRSSRADSWYDTHVVAASLGDDAGVIGAGPSGLAGRPRPESALVLVNGVPGQRQERCRARAGEGDRLADPVARYDQEPVPRGNRGGGPAVQPQAWTRQPEGDVRDRRRSARRNHDHHGCLVRLPAA